MFLIFWIPLCQLGLEDLFAKRLPSFAFVLGDGFWLTLCPIDAVMPTLYQLLLLTASFTLTGLVCRRSASFFTAFSAWYESYSRFRECSYISSSWLIMLLSSGSCTEKTDSSIIEFWAVMSLKFWFLLVCPWVYGFLREGALSTESAARLSKCLDTLDNILVSSQGAIPLTGVYLPSFTEAV